MGCQRGRERVPCLLWSTEYSTSWPWTVHLNHLMRHRVTALEPQFKESQRELLHTIRVFRLWIWAKKGFPELKSQYLLHPHRSSQSYSTAVV